MSINKKKYLVTGATGFLGYSLVRRLLNEDKDVRVLVRKSSDLSKLNNLKLDIAYGCLSDFESMDKAFRDVSIVINCAAKVSDFGRAEDFNKANVIGVKNLLDCSFKHNLERVIHISTTDVYGYPNLNVDETRPINKKGFLYGDSKIDGELQIWSFYKEHNIPITVLRPATIYGKNSIIVDEVLNYLKEGKYMHINKGNNNAGLVYIENVVDAILLVEKIPKSIGQVYNLTDTPTVTWREFVKKLAQAASYKFTDKSIPFFLAYIVGMVSEFIFKIYKYQDRPYATRTAVLLFGTNQSFSSEKIRKELGWETKVSLEEGIKEIFSS